MTSHWFEQEEKGSDESRTAYAHPAFEAPKWIQGGQLELRKPDSLQQTESVIYAHIDETITMQQIFKCMKFSNIPCILKGIKSSE